MQQFTEYNRVGEFSAFGARVIDLPSAGCNLLNLLLLMFLKVETFQMSNFLVSKGH